MQARTGGKGSARRMRVDGRIPGVVYGGGNDTVSISLDPKELDSLMAVDRGRSRLLAALAEHHPTRLDIQSILEVDPRHLG